MNWLKKIWKRFSEPLPPYAPAKAPTTASPTVMPITHAPAEENLSNFTPRAQQVLALSRKEADRFNHNFVGTEHLLLGLLKLGQGVAVNVLQKFGLDLEKVRNEIEQQVGTGAEKKPIGWTLPFTPRVKKVLALANNERRALNHTYVGTEHILLGLLHEGDGVAARVLKNLEVDIEATRVEILKDLDPNFALDYSQAKASEADKSSLSTAGSEGIDLTKRYDVYCSERQDVVVVYRKCPFQKREETHS